MATDTKIQWCDDTVNPTMGCDGCELWNRKTGVKRCYAGILHERHGGKNSGYAPRFEQVTRFPGRMGKAANAKCLRGKKRRGKPWLNGMPRMYFVSDMSDSLSKAVDFEFLEAEIIDNTTSAAGERHAWLWLTKQPGRMKEFSRWLEKREIGWPPNLWVGTSVTTMQTTWRVDELLQVGDEKSIRFLSIEPQWQDLDLGKWLQKLDWIIQGGESGTGAVSFPYEWARRLRDDCAAAGTPYFLKQVGPKPTEGGHPVEIGDSHGGNWAEWPEDLRVRQVPERTGVV